MRKSLVVLSCVISVLTTLIVAQLAGVFSYWMFAVTLLVGGVALILCRTAVSSWIQTTAGDFLLMKHWREVRPTSVVLFGIGMLVLAAGVLIDGKS